MTEAYKCLFEIVFSFVYDGFSMDISYSLPKTSLAPKTGHRCRVGCTAQCWRWQSLCWKLQFIYARCQVMYIRVKRTGGEIRLTLYISVFARHYMSAFVKAEWITRMQTQIEMEKSFVYRDLTLLPLYCKTERTDLAPH